jgi:hypothetical protein
MILKLSEFLAKNIKGELKKVLLKHTNIIGNQYMSFNDSIRIYFDNKSLTISITTNIKNPRHTNFMSSADFAKERNIVYKELEKVSKPLIKDVEKFLYKDYKEIESGLVVEDEAYGDGSYWAEILIEAEFKLQE